MPTIDADAHVIETENTWNYLERDEAQFQPVLLSANRDGRQFWLIDGNVFPRSNVNKAIPIASREMLDVKERLRHLDELELDVQVLYPTVFLRQLTRKPEVEIALCKSYNRWLADLCQRGEGRLKWVATLPLMSMDAALMEARFVKEQGACGLFTRGLVNNRSFNDPYFYPLFEEASRLDLPVCVHASAGSFEWLQLFDRESGFAQFKLPVLSSFHTIVYDGIPEKFPKLRIGFIEVRAEWIPYLLVDLAKRLEKKRGKIMMADLMSEQRLYVACQTDDDLSFVLKYSGENNLLIGSDYGHVDTSAEIDALKKMKTKGDVSSDVIDKILWDNPKAFYKI